MLCKATWFYTTGTPKICCLKMIRWWPLGTPTIQRIPDVSKLQEKSCCNTWWFYTHWESPIYQTDYKNSNGNIMAQSIRHPLYIRHSQCTYKLARKIRWQNSTVCTKKKKKKKKKVVCHFTCGLVVLRRCSVLLIPMILTRRNGSDYKGKCV